MTIMIPKRKSRRRGTREPKARKPRAEGEESQSRRRKNPRAEGEEPQTEGEEPQTEGVEPQSRRRGTREPKPKEPENLIYLNSCP